MKNWEIINGEYTRKVMWINHEIEMKLYCNGEDDIDEDELDETEVEEMVEKILENKEYWDKKCKNLFAEEFVDWFNEEEWVKPEYAEIYYETKSIDEVEKKLLKIIGKEDTEKIMKNNFLTKEAFKKLLDNKDMEIQDFGENTSSSYFKEWYGKIIWKGKEIRVRLTISKECDNIEIEKEKMFKIFEELYLNQDEWNEKVKDTMVKYFYDVLNDDFFDDGVFPEYPTCYDMLFEILKDDFTKEEAERIWKTKVFPLDKYRNYIFVDNIQITSEGNFYFEVADDYTVVGDNWIWLKGNIDKGFFAASFDDLFEFVTDLELNDEFSSILREKFKIGYADASSFFVSRREGLTKLYYKKNHKLAAIGNYKAGKKEGIWEFYDEDGKLTKKVNYVNDIAEEEVVY